MAKVTLDGNDLGEVTDPALLAYYSREPGAVVDGVPVVANDTSEQSEAPRSRKRTAKRAAKRAAAKPPAEAPSSEPSEPAQVPQSEPVPADQAQAAE